MPLIHKISALGLGAIATAIGTSGASYLMTKTEPEKVMKEKAIEIYENHPWGKVNSEDEDGADAWWKCCDKAGTKKPGT